MKKSVLMGLVWFGFVCVGFSAVTIDPPTRTFAKEGGASSVLTSGSGTWEASTAASWLTITPRTNGNAGESCVYVVNANLSADLRRDTIHIAGLVHTVTQTGYDAILSPSSATYAKEGGSGSVSITVAAGASWSATSSVPWIAVQTASGIGNGTVAYTVSPYAGVVTRVGTMIIGSKTFTVTQTGADVNISPSSANKAYSSDIIQVVVSALHGTSWTVTPNNGWITVVDAGNGYGDSVITLAIGSNPSYAARVGTVSVGSATFTIRQDGLRTPSMEIIPTISTAAPSGVLGNIAVSATPDSPWNAQSQTSWILISSGSNGSGNGNINYIASANPTISNRVGTILVNGPPPNFASCDFSRGALHIFSNRADYARTDIVLQGGDNYPDFMGTERATLTGYGIKDTHDWAIGIRFRHNSDGATHRLLYYVEDTRAFAIWVDGNNKLNLRSDDETYTMETLNIAAGSDYFVLAQGGATNIEIYACVQGEMPARLLQQSRTSSVFPPNANLLNLNIGGSEVPTSGNYIGNLNLLSIHNRKLTTAEIENYRQGDPWMDADTTFSSTMFVSRSGTNITPNRALMMRGSLRDQMDLGKAKLMNGTNQNLRFKTTTDRNGTPGSALDLNNGSDYRLALGSNTFRTLAFWFKTTNATDRTLAVMRSTKAGSVTHQCRYEYDYNPTLLHTAMRTTGGNPDYYSIKLDAFGRLGIIGQALVSCPLDEYFNDQSYAMRSFSWVTSNLLYQVLGESTFSTTPSAWLWHHIAMSLTGTGALKLFLDGEEIGNTAIFSSNLDGQNLSWFGEEFRATHNMAYSVREEIVDPSPMHIDEFATYSEELSPSEIRTLYNSQKHILREFTLVQPPLPVTVSPASSNVPANGGTAEFNLTVGGNVGWTATLGTNWLSLLSPASGAGPATIRVEAAANGTVYTRTGIVTIAGQTVQVVQAGRWAVVSSNNIVLPPDGGSVFVDVSVEGAAFWQSISDNSWLTIALGASGTGNGSVMVVADPYGEYSRSRIGSVQIAGHPVFISQRGYDLTANPSSVEIGSNAGVGELAITAPLSAVWEAIATAPWIMLVGGNTGIGSGTLRYSVSVNDTGEIRTGRIIISGVEYVIQQGVNPTDHDSDGMPTDWELTYGFNPYWDGDADLDADNDGLSNLREYQLGTNPLLADSSGDGVPDGTAYALETMGFDPLANSSNLVVLLRNNRTGLGFATSNDVSDARLLGRGDVTGAPNSYGLFTTNQMHGMAMGGLVLDRNAQNGRFRVGIGLLMSSDLINWQAIPASNITLHLTNGMIETDVIGDADAAFYRFTGGAGD